jgi:1,4-alpha-glucan branching enzyme
MPVVAPHTLTPWHWHTHGQVAPVWPGAHQTLGATWSPEATNFAVWAPEATSMWVCFFDDEGTETRHQLTERTLGVWHGAIPQVPLGQLYGCVPRARGIPTVGAASTRTNCSSTPTRARCRAW